MSKQQGTSKVNHSKPKVQKKKAPPPPSESEESSEQSSEEEDSSDSDASSDDEVSHAEPEIEEPDSEPEPEQESQRKKNGKPTKEKGEGGVDGITDQLRNAGLQPYNAVNKVGKHGQQLADSAQQQVGQTAGNALDPNQGPKEESADKNQPLRLRLDLNLDAEIELKAKIRGDITLSLL